MTDILARLKVERRIAAAVFAVLLLLALLARMAAPPPEPEASRPAATVQGEQR